MKLSVIIPTYNESATIETLLKKVLAVPIHKEIIVVDDGSQDNTALLLKPFVDAKSVKYFRHEKNQGKGSAIKTAIRHLTGNVVIIQDADLEYDPEDYNKLIDPIIQQKAQVVYGSRFLNKSNKHSYMRFYLGGIFVSFIANILYHQKLTDEPTCYKVFDAAFLKSIPLKCERFEFCPEITAKIAKKGIRIREIPINYYPRSIKEGKKINWKDGLEAIWTLIKYRFIE
ncbi:MAG: glycosyltransferase family 2 protein [Candidatus Marinimicrobia bacterium]|nr:glycosyltransferase family 2 protein [Candidatus Neomarinimicrobiota bacterium]